MQDIGVNRCARKSDSFSPHAPSWRCAHRLSATGQAHDLRETALLIQDLECGAFLGDRAFDADWLRQMLKNKGIMPIIPPKSNRKFPADFDKHAYKARHLVENYFQKINKFKRVALRACKTDDSFKAMISIVATVIHTR